VTRDGAIRRKNSIYFVDTGKIFAVAVLRNSASQLNIPKLEEKIMADKNLAGIKVAILVTQNF